jgi:hypothetical protein
LAELDCFAVSPRNDVKEKASVSPMLEDWHDFYILLGTAAAALVALLFVAASVGASMLTPERTRATRTYLSLFASLIALIPTQTPLWLGISVGSVALIGLLYSFFVCFRLFRDHVADIADSWAMAAARPPPTQQRWFPHACSKTSPRRRSTWWPALSWCFWWLISARPGICSSHWRADPTRNVAKPADQLR